MRDSHPEVLVEPPESWYNAPCRRWDSNPHEGYPSTVFETVASACSATSAPICVQYRPGYAISQVNERALIAAAKSGDTGSFNQLVSHYQDMVYNVAYRILGDTEAAADASQETFLSAYQAVGKFKGGSFKAWLLRIATNACYDQLRVHKRRPTSSLEAIYTDSDPSSHFVNGRETPEEHALRSELGKVIQQGITTLPPDQRSTLVLSDVQGMSYAEIADATGASIGTVKSRLSRARARLRDHLLEQGELLPARYRLSDDEG
jgi:RNA polymerase sigma-70 factor (ECF subfamily)